MSDTGTHPQIEERYCPSCDRSFVIPLKHCPNDGTKLVTLSSDPLLGRVLEDRFRIDEKLGAGGMGTVYSGSQTTIGRKIAIKVIHSRLSQRTEVVKRFLREAKLASRLNQPNTVTVLDFGQTSDGLLYLVMELLEGRTLGQVMRDDAPLTIGRAARIGMQLCDALEGAHNHAIIHRDLKPSNVVILDQPAGRDYLKVLDFGLAKSLTDDSATTITNSDAILGTPAYISPEAVLGRETDARADLYALGIILYQMITGRLPFDATTANLMLTSHINEMPRPLPAEVDARMRELIERLLAKNPDDRPATAAEVRTALEPLRSIEESLPAASHSEIAIADTVSPDDAFAKTTAETPERPPRRPALAVGALAVVAIGAVVALVLGLGGANDASDGVPPDAAPQTTPTAAAADAARAPAALIDAGNPATIDAAATPLPIDAAPERDRRRVGRRRSRDAGKQTKHGTDTKEPPPPVYLRPTGDGGVP